MRKFGWTVGMALALAGCAHIGDFEPYREVSCFSGARLSLTDAIMQARGGMGRVLDADYRLDDEFGCIQNDPGEYDITIFQDGVISEVSVNARTGAVEPREPASVMSALIGGHPFAGSHSDMVPLVPRMKINMPEAIAIAEREGGKAMVSWIEERNGKAGYAVKLVTGGRVRGTWVDAETPAT